MQIGGEGFGDLRKMWSEILAAKSIEPINEDVDEMAKQDMMMKNGDESQPKSPEIVPLYSSQNNRMEPRFGKIFSDMEECDPMLDRSLIFKQLPCAFALYAETFQ